MLGNVCQHKWIKKDEEKIPVRFFKFDVSVAIEECWLLLIL